MFLSKEIELLHYKREDIMLLSWSKLKKQLVGHQVTKANITALRKSFLGSGKIVTFGDSKNWGQASD